MTRPPRRTGKRLFGKMVPYTLNDTPYTEPRISQGGASGVRKGVKGVKESDGGEGGEEPPGQAPLWADGNLGCRV